MTGKRPLPHEGPHAHRHDLRLFQGVEAWIFDLDNTLYPHDADLFSQINEQIAQFVQDLLGLPREEAMAHQKALYHAHGTTLRGLMSEHSIDPDAYLRFVHDIDYSNLAPNPELGGAIEALPGKKFIFTNGDRPHAERTAAALGISDHFEDIFDIVSADLIPKPNRETYDKFLERTGVSSARSAMFEDLSKNLKVPHQLGMCTTLIVPTGSRELFRESWDMEGDPYPHVDFATDDLTGFLKSVLGALAQA
ncbi:pyrimidine 5'-nucleotidase [Roseibium porphyridii]|uniref:Pyrimidine 5'-nucleotidase n=1 Tax=Roseibium porphyridii TaxID=2866279 RepID=A0ABY8F1A4_9HYPH|nr:MULTISPECIES: pyrimidine 5'-nucleotidase [Stappiaceae]QFT34142.1 haloacid dehalogenase-like hydrolase [Labrenzia sp. THAF82]WFE89159.1 pyrimidine 5'-nucleotidase [Roseibium sp. KMA01]